MELPIPTFPSPGSFIIEQPTSGRPLVWRLSRALPGSPICSHYQAHSRQRYPKLLHCQNANTLDSQVHLLNHHLIQLRSHRHSRQINPHLSQHYNRLRNLVHNLLHYLLISLLISPLINLPINLPISLLISLPNNFPINLLFDLLINLLNSL